MIPPLIRLPKEALSETHSSLAITYGGEAESNDTPAGNLINTLALSNPVYEWQLKGEILSNPIHQN